MSISIGYSIGATIALGFIMACSTPYWVKSKATYYNDPVGSALYVCVDLPSEQQNAAFEAINMWSSALEKWRTIKVLNGQDSVCRITIQEVMQTSEENKSLGWASMIGGKTISLVKGRYEHDTTGILLHEIGHALGAQHLSGTLMNPSYQADLMKCPDGPTVAQVAAFNHVELGLLSYCTR